MKQVATPAQLIARNPKADAAKIAEALAILKATGNAGPTEYRLTLPYSRPIARSDQPPADPQYLDLARE